MQSSSEQPLVGEERYVTTLITDAKETKCLKLFTHSLHHYKCRLVIKLRIGVWDNGLTLLIADVLMYPPKKVSVKIFLLTSLRFWPSPTLEDSTPLN